MVREQRDILGKGWAFAIRPGAGGRLGMVQGAEAVRQSIWLILSTAQGERLMLPEYGCGIHDLVFEANTAALHGLVQRKVREALLNWEPRIDVMDVTVETPPDRGNYLLVRIEYRIRSNNSLFNLVYPFFLNEGAS